MEFWRGLEDPRSDRIYSLGNRGVKKATGPQGTRVEEFLVSSLGLRMKDYEIINYYELVRNFESKFWLKKTYFCSHKYCEKYKSPEIKCR